MKVRDVMTRSVASCRTQTNLGAAGELMWESDCGVLPVVDDRNRVAGVLTDRDICVALTTRDRRASIITAGEAATMPAHVCAPDDDIHKALKLMREQRIRRVPVVSQTGMLEGIVSLNDIVLRAEKPATRKRPEVSFQDVVETLQAICGHRSGEGRRAA